MNLRSASALVKAAGLIVCLALSGTSIGAFASTTGMISGYVYSQHVDGSGRAPVPGATVRVVMPYNLTNVYLATKADAHGFFSLVSVVPGNYWVYPSKENWSRDCPAVATVFADQTTTVSLTLLPTREADRVFGKGGCLAPRP
jgi:hypothetical protein